MKLLLQTMLTLRDYIKTNMKILCIYKNYNNSQINIDGSKIWDIVQVVKFKTRSKSMTLLIIK